MERYADNMLELEHNLPVTMPEEVVTANVRTSEHTHRMEMISRSRIEPRMRMSMMNPLVDWDRNHSGGCYDRVSSNCDTVVVS